MSNRFFRKGEDYFGAFAMGALPENIEELTEIDTPPPHAFYKFDEKSNEWYLPDGVTIE